MKKPIATLDFDNYNYLPYSFSNICKDVSEVGDFISSPLKKSSKIEIGNSFSDKLKEILCLR
jgi:hypothetical protein